MTCATCLPLRSGAGESAGCRQRMSGLASLLQKGGALQSRTIVTYQLTVEPILASTEYIRTEDCGVSSGRHSINYCGTHCSGTASGKAGNGVGFAKLHVRRHGCFEFQNPILVVLTGGCLEVRMLAETFICGSGRAGLRTIHSVNDDSGRNCRRPCDSGGCEGGQVRDCRYSPESATAFSFFSKERFSKTGDTSCGRQP